MPNLFRLALTLALCWLAATASAAVSGTITSVSYVGTGTTGPFPVTFGFIYPTDLRVQMTATTGAITTLTYASAYTVSGGAAPNSTQPLTGSVTLTTALPSGAILAIDRGNMPQTQPVVLPNAGPVQATAVSGGLDRGTLLVQQAGSIATRSLQLPLGDTATTILPVASARAGGFLGFDSSGNAIISQTSPSVPPTSWVSVKTYGAVGDGSHDDTTAIQATINAVALTGGVVYLPGGTYKVTSGLFVTDNNVVIQGAGGWLFHDAGTYTFAGTKIQRVGGPATEVMVFITPSSTTGARKSGLGMHDVWIDGGAAATTGVFCQSFMRGSFSDIHVSGVTDSAFKLSSYTSASHAEAMDLQLCEFTRLTWRLLDSGSQTATGIYITSAVPATDTANVSYNEFHMCTGQTWVAPGIQIDNGDSNQFYGCRTFVDGPASPVVPGLLIRGLSVNCDLDTFNNCAFTGTAGGSGGIRIQGVPSGLAHSPTGCIFFCMDDGNGTLFPTMDYDCDCQWHGMIGGWQRLRYCADGQFSYRRVTYGPATPASDSPAKAWIVGDRRVNSSPAVSSPKGWTCTVAGTPGTWVSEGNL